MKIRTSSGTIMESTNELVIEQWKKKGYKEVSTPGRKPKDIPEPLKQEEE